MAAVGAALDRLASARRRPGLDWMEIRGEPGIGKSRLIGELAELADARGHLVLRGHGAELEQDIPFNALVDALDDYLGAVDPARLRQLGADRLDELAAVFPALRSLGTVPTGDTSEMQRWQTYRAARALLELLAANRPLVLALDDLHWADTASVELVAHLLRRPPNARVLLVVAVRPRQVPEALAAALSAAALSGRALSGRALSGGAASAVVAATDGQAGANSPATVGVRLELAPLSPEDSDALLSPVTRDPVVRRRWYRESGGNPFYLEQLARTRAPTRPLSAVAGPSSVPPALTASTGLDGPDDVPPAVTAAVGAEIAQLPEVVRRFAQGAAVAGEVFEPDLAAEAAALPETDAFEALDALVAADVVRPTEVPRRFMFRHPIVRHAIYMSAGPGWRIAAHARAADALAARGAAATARAHHVERAARPGDEAAIALLTKAAAASRLRAPAAAAHWYAAALRLLPGGESSPGQSVDVYVDADGGLRRLELLSRLAAALDASYQPQQARVVLDEIMDLIPREFGAERAHLVALRSAVDHVLGRHGEARALVLDAVASAEPGTRESCLLRLQLAIDHFYTGEYDGMRRWQQEAHALAGTLDDAPLLAASAGLLAGAEYMVGDVSAAIAEAAGAARRYDLLSDDQVIPHLDKLAWLGWTEAFLERFTDALRHLDRVDALALRNGRGSIGTLTAVARSLVLTLRGRLPEAAAAAEAAVEACLLTPHLPFLSWALAARCAAATLAGDLPEALRSGAQGVRAANPETDAVSVMAGSYFAEALVEAGEPDRAVDELLGAAGGAELPRIEAPIRPYWYEVLTRAELARGMPEAAAGWAVLAERTAADAGGGLAGRKASAMRARAAVEFARGQSSAAAASALASAAEAERAGLPIELGRSLIVAGRALAADGQNARAVSELRRAESRLDACGANRPRDEAARLLRQLGERVSRGGRPSARAQAQAAATLTRHQTQAVVLSVAAGTLSARERQIAELVAAGQTNRQIAAALFVSEKTVESHLTKVLAKLGVPTRAGVGSALRS
ncbi:LuxR family transcriptional regulator [Parafrankia colletiae]|uniref:LuxR family transcriptional regulator n=2 Tax=Parafrankia colletiae TaxID=573497 RepID=A0A1S1QCF3_9ACTN|nr:AAA family ATPase [Frankia sp. Cpl3]OHV31670.1 LuxR family transcriptional regulator [Parafrankia colletiae]